LRTLIHISAQPAGFSLEASLTNTLTLRAEFSTRAGLGHGALDSLNLSLTSNIWISGESGWTFAPVPSGGVLTESSFAARLAKTFVDINAALLALSRGLVSLVAHAPWLPVDQGALGVGRAEYICTWTFAVGTLVRFGTNTYFAWAAKSISRTVIVFVAGFHADTFRWVARICNRTRWTPTLVRSGQVLTSCSESASADRLALINIDTSDLRVARVSWLALADEAAGQVSTQAVLPASPWGSTLIHIDTTSSNILWVVGPAILAHTVGILRLCLAVRMLAAGDTLARL
jgi:hypothetical protein